MSDLPAYELDELPPYSVNDSSKQHNNISNRMSMIKLLVLFINSYCFLLFNIFRLCVGIIFWNDECENVSNSPYDINIKFHQLNVIFGCIHIVISIMLLVGVYKYFVHIKNRKQNPENIFTLFHCKYKCITVLMYFFVFMTPLFTCTIDLLMYTSNYNTPCGIIITIPSIANVIYFYSITAITIIVMMCYCCFRVLHD